MTMLMMKMNGILLCTRRILVEKKKTIWLLREKKITEQLNVLMSSI